MYLAQKGVVAGYANGLFAPQDALNRAQLAKIIVKTLGIHTPSIPSGAGTFSDVPNEGAGYPFDYVEEAAANGVVGGFTDGSFGPYNYVTRVQLTRIVVRAERVFRVGYDQDFAPFAYKDEAGVAHGWSIELVQAACDRVNLEVLFIPTTMPVQASMFAGGQLDAVMDKAVNAPRVLNEFEFSQHYVLTGAALLRPLGEPALSLADVAGLTLVTPGTGPVYSYLQGAVPTATLVSTPDYRSSFEAVLAGTADAAALNSDVGYDLAEKLFPGQFGRPGARFMESGLAMARPKDMGRDFLDSFDAGLAMIRSDGTLAAILGDR